MGANYRIFPGDSLKKSITARSWNRLQSAADRVLEGDFAGQSAGLARHEWQTVLVRVPRYQPSVPAEFEWRYGYAIGLEQFSTYTHTMWPADRATRPSTNVAHHYVTKNELPVLGAAAKTIDVGGLGFASESFGIVCGVDGDATHWFLRVIVRGIVTIRVVGYAMGDRVLGPPPCPPSSGSFAAPALRSVWEPYAMMAPAGRAEILAIGGVYQMIAGKEWPRLYEAIVKI